MQMKEYFNWLPEVFLRAPLYSVSGFSAGDLDAAMQTNLFKNALFLASPALYDIVAKKDFQGKRLSGREMAALLKYYNRMCFRPTPFGAFASFTLLNWTGRAGPAVLSGLEASRLHLLPSNEFLRQLSSADSTPEDDQPVMLNPTAYELGGMIRYIKTERLPSGKFDFLLSGIAAEELNLFIADHLRRARLPVTEVISLLADAAGATRAEAADYVDFLLQEQVIYGAGQGDIFESGCGSLSGLLPREDPDDLPPLFTSWPSAESRPALSSRLLARDAAVWQQASAFNKGLPEKGIFYGALERPLQGGGVPLLYQQQIDEALSVLARLVPERPASLMADFKAAFRARFDLQKVPLLRALDPDAGVTYGDPAAIPGNGEWVRDMDFATRTPAVPPMPWTALHRLFLEKWAGNARLHPQDPILISPSDLEGLPEISLERLPAGMAVLFSLTSQGLVIDTAGGSSALPVIGRFTAFSSEVEALACRMAALETAANPDIVFADIGQLSHEHVDNINRRKLVYHRQIPVNTFSSVSPERQLALADLVLSLQGEELVLESISLQRRVIPRLSTAYNYHQNGLGIFRFLCDLQFDGIRSNFSLDLPSLFPGLSVYPRVVCNQVILAVGRWHIEQAEILELTARPLSLGRLHLFRERHHIPHRVLMGSSDQQLAFDLSRDWEAQFFLDCISGMSQIVLREHLLPDGQVKAGKQVYQGQYIGFLHKLSPTYAASAAGSAAPVSNVPRSFEPGSDWLYLKLYVTSGTADSLLLDVLLPLLREFRDQIQGWFFVRYNDTGPHLRLRFRLPQRDTGNLLIAFREYLSRNGRSELIRDYQSDIYQREIERYTAALIEEVETFFVHGSDYVLACLEEEASGRPADRQLLALHTAWHLARRFYPEEQDLFSFIRLRAEAMRQEYLHAPSLKRQFDARYREKKQDITAQLEAGIHPEGAGEYRIRSFHSLLQQTAVIAEKSSHWTEIRRQSLLGDLIHMQLNRIFGTLQRQQEALTFHCLSKYLLSGLKHQSRMT